MGGFFMLIELILFRMGPLVLLWLCKERRKMKWMLIWIFGSYAAAFLYTFFAVFSVEKWKAVLYLLLAAIPHFFLYGFAGWILFQCLFAKWSQRVWKRILGVSCGSVFLGILVEFYINPQILNFFVKNF